MKFHASGFPSEDSVMFRVNSVLELAFAEFPENS